eukprot:768399-Hanusia_phi.AAC.11
MPLLFLRLLLLGKQERGCNRNEQQCLQRWKRINPELRKGPWSPEEDEILQRAVETLAPWACCGGEDGELRDPREVSKSMPWIEIAKIIPGRRADQQARSWTAEEDMMLEEAVNELGVGRSSSFLPLSISHVSCFLSTFCEPRMLATRWAKIATSFPGRTPRQCRLHWEVMECPKSTSDLLNQVGSVLTRTLCTKIGSRKS